MISISSYTKICIYHRKEYEIAYMIFNFSRKSGLLVLCFLDIWSHSESFETKMDTSLCIKAWWSKIRPFFIYFFNLYFIYNCRVKDIKLDLLSELSQKWLNRLKKKKIKFDRVTWISFRRQWAIISKFIINSSQLENRCNFIY